jgi:energy-coupling factor transport system permease protein
MTRILSLYVEEDTLVHKIDPINKILYIIVAVAVPVILPYGPTGLVFIFISAVILLASKVFKKVIPLIEFSFLILFSIVVIQGLFHPGNRVVAFNIGRFKFYREGLLYAFTLSIRVINILVAFSVLVLTTKPSDLIEALVRKGLSPRFGYVLSSTLQIIPQMISTVGSIMDAQRSRGLETEGNLAVRIRAFFPLIGPVVMNSLIETRERAMALEVRAFNSKEKKTFLNERKDIRSDRVILLGLLFILVLAIIFRVFL